MYLVSTVHQHSVLELLLSTAGERKGGLQQHRSAAGEREGEREEEGGGRE